MHGVVTTSVFEADAKAAGLGEGEVTAIVEWLAAHPLAGNIMPGTGGARKVRFARPGKGKSGGYRTIHYYAGENMPLFLLALVDKGERANLSKAERNALAGELATLAEDYRAGISAGVARKRW